jgi:hypothetical protein
LAVFKEDVAIIEFARMKCREARRTALPGNKLTGRHFELLASAATKSAAKKTSRPLSVVLTRMRDSHNAQICPLLENADVKN